MKTMRKLFMLAIAMVTAIAIGQPGPVAPPVTQIVAGTGITISPSSGTGNVTINATATGGTWGTITGTLSSQTDLNSALSGKVPTTRTVAGHALSSDVAVSAADLTTGAFLNGITAFTQNVGDNSTKIATTAYVDASVADDIEIKNPVVAATNTALLFSPSYSNGSSGVGATLTGGIGILIVDGYTPVLNDRILVKNEASTLTQGVYTVTRLGTVSIGYILTRALDFNQAANILYGDSVGVLQGTVNANQQFMMNNQNAITVGTTAITFAMTSGGSQLTSGNGITITGNSVAMATSAAMPGSPTVAGTASTAAGGIVTTDGTQTLTNKTLTSPAETNPTVTGTFTIGGSSAATVDYPNAGDTNYTATGGGKIIFAPPLRFNGALYDSAGSAGAAGQYMGSNGSGIMTYQALRVVPLVMLAPGSSGTTWTAGTSAGFVSSSGARNQVKFDASPYTQARISVSVGSTAPVLNTVLYVRYSASTTATFGSYSQAGAASTDVQVLLPASGETCTAGSWVTLVTGGGGANADNFWTLGGSAPSGSTNISVCNVTVEFR